MASASICHEGRSSYRPHLSASSLAGRQSSFFALASWCIVKHAPLQFLAERFSPVPRCVAVCCLRIRTRSCGSLGKLRPSRLPRYGGAVERRFF